MTKFTAFYDLCRIEDSKGFFGLSKDKEDGNIIATFGRNIIIIINITTQKQIRSWTVLDKLSSNVVYDSKSDQYVGVFSNFIRCWSEDEGDVNKKKKIQFQKIILELIQNNEETIVLYADGSCEYLSHAIETRKNKPEKQVLQTQTTYLIRNAKVFTLSNGQKLLTYFRKQEDSKTVTLVTVSLDHETGRPLNDSKEFVLDRRDSNQTLVSHAIVQDTNHLFLLTLWSDKRVFTMPLYDSTNEVDSPGSFVSMMNFLNVENPVSILGVSKNCIAIYGSNSVQEGSSLLLYNTQFSVINAKQFFKVYFNNSRLWKIGNNILLAMGHSLYVVSFKVTQELLSEMIGSQISNDLDGQTGTEFIKEDDEIEDMITFDSQYHEQAPIHRSIFSPNMPVADGKTIPYQPNDLFNENIEKIVGRNPEVYSKYTESSADVRISLFPHNEDTGFLTPELEVIAKRFEECGASEQEITEKILTIALKAQIVSDIIRCLKMYPSTSQRMLPKLLKFALEQISVDDFSSSSNNDENASSDSRISLLNTVLRCPVNASTILCSVKKELNFEQALVLIQYLYHIITTENQILEDRLEIDSDFLEETQTIEWMTIILNAFFQELGLSKNTQLVEVLKNWKETLSTYQEELQSLRSVQARLSSVIRGKALRKEKRMCKWYSIEKVKLY